MLKVRVRFPLPGRVDRLHHRLPLLGRPVGRGDRQRRPPAQHGHVELQLPRELDDLRLEQRALLGLDFAGLLGLLGNPGKVGLQLGERVAELVRRRLQPRLETEFIEHLWIVDAEDALLGRGGIAEAVRHRVEQPVHGGPLHVGRLFLAVGRRLLFVERLPIAEHHQRVAGEAVGGLGAAVGDDRHGREALEVERRLVSRRQELAAHHHHREHADEPGEQAVEQAHCFTSRLPKRQRLKPNCPQRPTAIMVQET